MIEILDTAEKIAAVSSLLKIAAGVVGAAAVL